MIMKDTTTKMHKNALEAVFPTFIKIFILCTCVCTSYIRSKIEFYYYHSHLLLRYTRFDDARGMHSFVGVSCVKGCNKCRMKKNFKICIFYGFRLVYIVKNLIHITIEWE